MKGPRVGQVGDLGEVLVIEGEREKLGACNFCTDVRHRQVFEIQGHQVSVRVCRKCMKSIRRQTYSNG